MLAFVPSKCNECCSCLTQVRHTGQVSAKTSSSSRSAATPYSSSRIQCRQGNALVSRRQIAWIRRQAAWLSVKHVMFGLQPLIYFLYSTMLPAQSCESHCAASHRKPCSILVHRTCRRLFIKSLMRDLEFQAVQDIKQVNERT